jgi:hypothetical protein
MGMTETSPVCGCKGGPVRLHDGPNPEVGWLCSRLSTRRVDQAQNLRFFQTLVAQGQLALQASSGAGCSASCKRMGNS